MAAGVFLQDEGDSDGFILGALKAQTPDLYQQFDQMTDLNEMKNQWDSFPFPSSEAILTTTEGTKKNRKMFYFADSYKKGNFVGLRYFRKLFVDDFHIKNLK